MARPVVQSAKLRWTGQDAPFSTTFDDIYFNPQDGLAESRFVFLDGVNLDGLLAERRPLVVGETGFGTGLNFLLTWDAWRQAGRAAPLSFLSVEAFPLVRDDLAHALAAFDMLSERAAPLIAAWPPPDPGLHRIAFDGGRVELLLHFGEAASALADMQASVDAWYLDGFAPAKNPDMWRDAVFQQVARLSRPAARLATFTAAGSVRRGLEAVGFAVDKVPGFGRKRERILGRFTGATVPPERSRPWFDRPASPSGPIAIIGGGISGQCLAHQLHAMGREVTVFAAPIKAALPAAVIVPKLNLGDGALARWQTRAFVDAVGFYNSLCPDAWVGPRGARLTVDPPRRDEALAHFEWGDDWIMGDGEDGLFLPQAGTVEPGVVASCLLADVRQERTTVERLEITNTGWRLWLEDNRTADFPTVVVAAGWRSADLLRPLGVMARQQHNRGELAILAAGDGPRHLLSSDGYLTPPLSDTNGDYQVLGSTFERLADDHDDAWRAPRPQDIEPLLSRWQTAFGKHRPEVRSTWVGLRATIADHLPLVGPVASDNSIARDYAPLAQDARWSGGPPLDALPGLFLMSGMGSKGYQYAPLATALLAAQMDGRPLPLEPVLADALHPVRQPIKALIRGDLG